MQLINQRFGGLILKRHFADHPPISYDLIKERVMLVLKLYDKVDPKKVLKSSYKKFFFIGHPIFKFNDALNVIKHSIF